MMSSNVVPLRAGDESAPCPLAKCDGSGWIEVEDRVAAPCECRALRRKRTRGLASAIPPRYRSVSFDAPPVSDMARAPETRAVVGVVRDYVDNLDARLAEGRGLWLMGGVGTGKTTLAMLVSKAAASAGRSVAIYSLPRLLASIRRTYDGVPGEDTYSAFFERLASVDLLQIDDLGAENRTDWVLEQLYAIVDERYQAQRAVIVTSNVSYEELSEQIGSRVVSRLTEMCEELPLHGDDMRNRFTA